MAEVLSGYERPHPSTMHLARAVWKCDPFQLGGVGHMPLHGELVHVVTTVATLVVVVELGLMVRHCYTNTLFLSAAFQVVVGRVCVFLAGILIVGARDRCGE